jgi:hypothetical protein
VGTQRNVLEVVSLLCTDDMIAFAHSTLRTKHKLSRDEHGVKRMKNKFEELP